jgi:hypothetical protein
MTPEEKRKYRRIKPLAYIAAYGYEWPLRIVLVLILLLPGLLLEKAGDKIQDLYYYLEKWLLRKPLVFIFGHRLGFIALYIKAKRGL